MSLTVVIHFMGHYQRHQGYGIGSVGGDRHHARHLSPERGAFRIRQPHREGLGQLVPRIVHDIDIEGIGRDAIKAWQRYAGNRFRERAEI